MKAVYHWESRTLVTSLRSVLWPDHTYPIHNFVCCPAHIGGWTENLNQSLGYCFTYRIICIYHLSLNFSESKAKHSFQTRLDVSSDEVNLEEAVPSMHSKLSLGQLHGGEENETWHSSVFEIAVGGIMGKQFRPYLAAPDLHPTFMVGPLLWGIKRGTRWGNAYHKPWSSITLLGTQCEKDSTYENIVKV